MIVHNLKQIILLTIVLLFIITKSYCQKNNVCKNWIDYFYINSSPNCWYNPDVIGDVVSIPHQI